MSAIAGIAGFQSRPDDLALQRQAWALAERQTSLGHVGDIVAATGACVVPNLSEKHPDPFAVELSDGLLLIGQARPLRIPSLGFGAAVPTSDLFAAWRRWGEAALPRISGDFLLLEWDTRLRRLRIARAPLSEFNLFLHVDANYVQFATTAPALGAGQPDLSYLALQTSGRPLYGTTSTAFSGVEAVPPGSLTVLTRLESDRRFFWRPEEDCGEALPDGLAAERLRAAMLEAAGELIADANPVVASHLSAGRDSGATSAVAAHLLARERRSLLACTSIPRPGYGHVDDQYLYDEGPAAAVVAAQYPNIIHRRLVTPPTQLGVLLEHYNQVLHSGHGTPASLPWWSHWLEVAATAGASTLLSGGMGNLTVSSGEPWVLADLLRAAQRRA